MRGNQLVPQVVETNWYFAYTKLNICGKKFDAKVLIFDKMVAL